MSLSETIILCNLYVRWIWCDFGLCWVMFGNGRESYRSYGQVVYAPLRLLSACCDDMSDEIKNWLANGWAIVCVRNVSTKFPNSLCATCAMFGQNISKWSSMLCCFGHCLGAATSCIDIFVATDVIMKSLPKQGPVVCFFCYCSALLFSWFFVFRFFSFFTLLFLLLLFFVALLFHFFSFPFPFSGCQTCHHQKPLSIFPASLEATLASQSARLFFPFDFPPLLDLHVCATILMSHFLFSWQRMKPSKVASVDVFL